MAGRIINLYCDAEYIYTKQEADVAARLLHDLKNTIVGYAVALSQNARNTTEALTYKLQASRHRDSALSLTASLRSIWGTLASPVPSSIDPIRFIRVLVAESMNTLPIGVRIIPPSSRDEKPFTTSAELLRSILQNLIKNSIEAMPKGGDIRIEAVRYNDVLLLEVADSGPGMKGDLLRKVLAGELVGSTKKEGSGLGLFTVQGMLRRINGRLSGTSESGRGLAWTIELTELPLADTERPQVWDAEA